ncbi:phage tail tape measure protein [Helcococcus bovis]|uniref:phage tail tape measure protein n=1 Tax=Helcococcus bovis TaxID=3153252 RepID=UPI0038BD7DD5
MQKALIKLGDEFLDTGTDVEKLNKYLESIGGDTSFNGLSDETKKFSDSLKQTEKSADGVSDSLEQMVAGGALTELADMAQAVVDKFVDIANAAREYANEQDDNCVKLQTNLSLTREEALSLGEVVDDVMAGGIVESSSEATDAVILVKKAFSELNDVELSKVTDKLLTLSKRTGTEVNENVRAAQVLIREFGLSSEEAFDYLAGGYQKGLNYSDDFVDTIKEYSPLFADANLLIEEFMDILLTGMENGAFNTDKTADAIKELHIRLADGSFENNLDSFSESTKNVFNDWKEGKATITDVMASIGEDIKKMDPSDQQAALTLLSTQFEDLGIEASIALLGIESSMGDVTGKADLMNQKTVGENWHGTLERLKDLLEPLGTSFQNIAQGALTIFVDALESLFNWFNNLNPVLQNIITGLGIFAGVFVALLPIVTSAIGIFTALKGISAVLGVGLGALAGPVGIVMAVIAALVAVGVLLYQNWETIKEYAIVIWEAIKNIFVTVVTSIGEFLSSAFEAIKNIFLTVFEVIKTIVSTYFEIYKTIITTVIEAIKTVITNVWEAIKFVITTVVNVIKTVIETGFNVIKEVITGILNTIKTVVTNVWNSIKTVISTVVNTIKTTIQNVFNTISSLITNVFNGIKNTTSNVWNGIKSTISNIVNSISSSISNVFNGIKNTVTTIWNGVKSAIITPIETAKNAVKRIVDAIKGFFSFKFSWPKIPMPHFGIKPKGWKIGDLLKGSIPSLGISWYKEGGIFDRPSVIGVGEAGSEALVPTHKLDKFLEDAVKRVKSKNNTSDAIVINIEKLEVREEADIERIGREILKEIKRYERGLSHG